MRLSYVLPDPASYADWSELEGDLECVRRTGYDAVELQIPDPVDFDEKRVRRSLEVHGLAMCAFQTGSTYSSRNNCLCTADDSVRQRTMELMRSFVDLAGRWRSVVVFGSLQGRLSDEPDRAAGAGRIRDAAVKLADYASRRGATIAFEPVQHGEVGFHNTIVEVAELVRDVACPGLRMMVDTFHMNIEERDLLAPLREIGDILKHVHLSETNRDVLGTGRWPTAAFMAELDRIGYGGHCSVGVYNTRLSRRECIVRCMSALRGR